ncbi:hypothetical protein HGRIS_000746 [Hohenbuehelia grisea]|uniref:F-box domain-containing protein n=1 Tax=Hohenbuehelia grisea TaxID=104357 RepID=A0ABR3IPL0_9AGAR
MAPMHIWSSSRALAVEEILFNILQECDISMLYPCMTVCKQWSGIALDAAWYKVDDPTSLFNLLTGLASGFGTGNSIVYKYRSRIQAQDLDRFINYSSRIRCLRFLQQADREYTTDDWTHAVRSVACMPFSRPLFPHLKELLLTAPAASFHGLADASVSLMQPSVLKFTLQTPAVPLDDDALAGYFQAIRLRMPHLQSFEMNMTNTRLDSDALLDNLFDLLYELPNLQSLALPEIAKPPSFVLPRLATLPMLQHLIFTPYSIDEVVKPLGVNVDEYAAWPLEPNSFPCLQRLETECSFTPIARFFLQTHHPRNLRHLDITSGIPERPDAIRHFLTAFAAASPHAESVRLVYRNDRRLPQKFKDLSIIPSLIPSPYHIEPLFHCRALKSFEFAHPYSINWQGSDVDRLASAWPLLELLDLTPCPQLRSPSLSMTSRLLRRSVLGCTR